MGGSRFSQLSITKFCSCGLFLHILIMPRIQFLDFQNIVSSVNNSMTEIVVFVCPQLYIVTGLSVTLLDQSEHPHLAISRA